MVKAHSLLILLCIVFLLVTFSDCASASWSGVFHIEQEGAKIWINQNGTIDLFYNITVKLDYGDDINYVNVGQPQADFTIGNAKDQYGNILTASDVSSGSDYKVKITLHTPLHAGQAVWFTLITNVAHMIYNDTQNPGNVGMQFIPVWWSATVQDLRVSIVLPSNVNESMVKTSVDWNNTLLEPDGRLTVFWEKQGLSSNEKFPVGVSFPKEYIQSYDTQPPSTVPPSGGTSFPPYSPVFLVFGVLIFFLIISAVVYAISKKPYLMPRVSMETLGIRRGLTAVEASYLLDMKPTKIVTEMLYSLLQKRAVWVESISPFIKLRIMPTFQKKTGTAEMPLRYYETDFLDAIRAEGNLDEEKLAGTVMLVRDTVEEKMRGYCRQDTVDYYRSIVAKAWEQVEQAGTPELSSKAYDEHLLWLLLDPNYKSLTQTAFRNRAFEPSPMWLWYWYGYQHYIPHPTYRPNLEAPAQAAKPPVIPGADFANNIAAAVENTSNNIVANLEKFANSILPMPPSKASSQPAHHDANCVCACHACACACACVSCACACAGGGVG